jgi:hypothetical protein
MSTRQLKKRFLIKITCSAVLILALWACAGDKDDPARSSSIELKVLNTITHDRDLNYVVRSIIYPEDPNTMFLTLRGGGISTYDVSDPANPKLLTHWDEVPCRNVEGQDRIENLLVVTDISRGGLFLFDVTDPANLVQLGYLKIDGIDNMLHNRIYRANDKMYALFSGGFHFTTGKLSDLFVAVDITDPKNPFFVSKLNTGISGTEGISIKGNHAFLGGFGSTKFSVIDLSDPANMKIVKTLDEPHYSQMVSEIGGDGVLYVSLWGGLFSDKGGLAAFDVSDPRNIHELSHVFSKGMGKANRVKIQGDYVFMPLEIESGGGVAIVDRTNPKNLLHVKTVLNIPEVIKPYCLAIKQDYLYLFSSKTNSMVVMQIIKD